MESTQATFLVGLEGPCFTAVEESAQHRSLVDSRLCVGGKHFAILHSLCQAGTNIAQKSETIISLH